MPTTASQPTDRSASIDTAPDPLEGVDHIVVIDNGAHNIRIASIPYPFPTDLVSPFTADPTIDPSILARNIAIDVFPNAIARTRTPHTVPASTSPTAPPPGTKTSIFVSSHIHTLLDDYAALHLRLPHQSGVVVDWAAQKQVWDHVFANHLAKLPGGVAKKGKLLQGKAVIVTEAYCNLEPVQYAMDLLLFEQYGAHAVWRTTAAGLVGLGGGEVFRSQSPQGSTVADNLKAEDESDSTPDEAATEHIDTSEASTSKASARRPARPPRASTTSTSLPPLRTPRILPPPLPQATLVLDLGYSYCHAIPILHSHPYLPSIRRLELGGKMLINLLKETLSFQQLDMMDESWLMSHIFARMSFVAGSVGRRGAGKDMEVLERAWRKEPVEWSYEDLLALERYGKGKRGRGEKSVRVTWSLPDYGGGVKSGGKERDRARYGYILDGPNPSPRSSEQGDEHDRKRPKLDPLSWESSFIASTNISSISRPAPPEEDDSDDTQTLTLTTERFSIVETLFNPDSLSLDQQPLPLLVRDAISSLSSSSLPHARAAADMMWSNIILVGGLANVVGMKRRLENELRSLAPIDVGVRIWSGGGPTDIGGGAGDASLVAVKSGVALACELSVKETARREAKGGGEGGRGKKKGRKSRGGVTTTGEEEDGEGAEGGGGGGRWLTYAQWMNVAGGSEAEVVRAANAVFYPTVEG